MSSTNYPPPPYGYQPAIRFEYPRTFLQIAAITLVIVLLPFLYTLTWLLQGQIPHFQAGFIELIIITTTIVITVIVHELIHGLTYQLLGYRVNYGTNLRLLAAYAAAFKQFQQRNHNLFVALAPLFVLTILLVPLLTIQNTWVVLIAFTAILFNCSGAVGDLYLSWRLLRLPPTTLMYDVDETTMLIYLPPKN